MNGNMYKILRKILYKMRNFIFSLSNRFPILGDSVEFGYYFLYYFKFTIEKMFLNFRTRLKYGKLDHNKICWVNPQNIQYYIDPHKYNKWTINSRILNGDWDCSETCFEDLREVKAIEQRFKENKTWEETELYHQYHDEFSRGIKWGFKNKEDIDMSFKGIDSLYNQIKKNGYKSKKELYSHKNIYGKLVNLKIGKKILDDITLAISRDGHFIFVNGKHRLKIAQLLNIPKISSIIVLRHKKWMEFRKKLINFSKKCQSGMLNYQHTHPDLQDIPFKNIDL